MNEQIFNDCFLPQVEQSLYKHNLTKEATFLMLKLKNQATLPPCMAQFYRQVKEN